LTTVLLTFQIIGQGPFWRMAGLFNGSPISTATQDRSKLTLFSMLTTYQPSLNVQEWEYLRL